MSGEEAGLHLRHLEGVCDTGIVMSDVVETQSSYPTYTADRGKVLQLLSLVTSVAAARICHGAGVLSVLR